MAVAQPGGAVDGLELDERQERGRGGRGEEEVVGDDEVEGVVHVGVEGRGWVMW